MDTSGQGYEVITVEAGREYKKNQDNYYEIQADNKADYKILFESLNEQGNLPEKVLQLWGASELSNKNCNEIELTQKLGYYSMLSLAQAYGELNYIQNLEVYVITNNMQQVIGGDLNCPEKATVLGPVKVIPQEYSNIKCKSIDVDLNVSNTSIFTEQIITELNGVSKDLVIAYRDGERYVEHFEKTPLDNKETGKERLRENGVYLITGGLGGLAHIAVLSHLTS